MTNKNLIVGVALLSAMPTLSQASGFALIELNARGQGNAYAGAAAHTPDASTIYFNPAGMMLLQDDQVVFAGHYIMPKSSFSDDGSKASDSALLDSASGAPLIGSDDDGGSNAIVPNFYWVKTLDADLKFGLGVNAPFGLATEYDDDWVGRYHGVISDLKTFNFNPSLAYRVNEQLSVGGGLNFMLGDVELSSAIDFGAICTASLGESACAGLGAAPQQADGFSEFNGDNFDNISTGFNLGLLYELSPATALGVAYRSEITMKVDGDVDFTVPAPVSFVMSSDLFLDTGIKAEVALPSSLSFSLAHRIDKLTYLADITWTGWSSFEELRIKYDNPKQDDSKTTEDWNDTMRYSFGIDYQYTDQLILRSGIAYDESPVPSAQRRTPRLPGSDRTWISLGASYRYTEELNFDLGYSHLFIDDAQIENQFESSLDALAATLDGDYAGSVDIFSVQVNWKY